jgi:hypothetical protein
MKNNKKIYAVELQVPEGACDDDVKDYLGTAIKTECGCRNPEEDPMYNLNRNSVKIMSFVKRGRIACLPTFQQWFDDNRSKLVDASPQDAALIMYDDLITILKNDI